MTVVASARNDRRLFTSPQGLPLQAPTPTPLKADAGVPRKSQDLLGQGALPLPLLGRGEISKRGTVTVPLQAVSFDNLSFEKLAILVPFLPNRGKGRDRGRAK